MRYLLLSIFLVLPQISKAESCDNIEALMSQYAKERYFMICMEKLMTENCDKPEIDTFACGDQVGKACYESMTDWQLRISVAWANCISASK